MANYTTRVPVKSSAVPTPKSRLRHLRGAGISEMDFKSKFQIFFSFRSVSQFKSIFLMGVVVVVNL